MAHTGGEAVEELVLLLNAEDLVSFGEVLEGEQAAGLVAEHERLAHYTEAFALIFLLAMLEDKVAGALAQARSATLNEELDLFDGNPCLCKLGLTGILRQFIIFLAVEKRCVEQIDHTLLVVLLVDFEQLAQSLIVKDGL